MPKLKLFVDAVRSGTSSDGIGEGFMETIQNISPQRLEGIAKIAMIAKNAKIEIT